MYKEREREREIRLSSACVSMIGQWAGRNTPVGQPPVPSPCFDFVSFLFSTVFVSVCVCDGDVDVGIIGFVTRTTRETNLAT